MRVVGQGGGCERLRGRYGAFSTGAGLGGGADGSEPGQMVTE